MIRILQMITTPRYSSSRTLLHPDVDPIKNIIDTTRISLAKPVQSGVWIKICSALKGCNEVWQTAASKEKTMSDLSQKLEHILQSACPILDGETRHPLNLLYRKQCLIRLHHIFHRLHHDTLASKVITHSAQNLWDSSAVCHTSNVKVLCPLVFDMGGGKCRCTQRFLSLVHWPSPGHAQNKCALIRGCCTGCNSVSCTTITDHKGHFRAGYWVKSTYENFWLWQLHLKINGSENVKYK